MSHPRRCTNALRTAAVVVPQGVAGCAGGAASHGFRRLIAEKWWLTALLLPAALLLLLPAPMLDEPVPTLLHLAVDLPPIAAGWCGLDTGSSDTARISASRRSMEAPPLHPTSTIATAPALTEPAGLATSRTSATAFLLAI